MAAPHFLLITFPSQGHINPGLQFAKYLVRCGAQVTFAMSVSARRGLTKSTSTTPNGITLATFSDGYDDHAAFDPENDSVEEYMSKIERRGSETLAELIVESANQGRPVDCLVYTCLIPWAAVVAREYHIQVAVLWIQPANAL
ncbi:hypothetical protein RJ641_004772 [Dillenia turbinata]|uniref:Uncharacterized protein n=1 Tax=Dillenia turbinata TaxID=194707 RepID=A0AAN8ZED6_9MAGN